MSSKPATLLQRLRWRLWIGPVLVAAAVGAYAVDLAIHDNFHTISSGLVYRSAQMGPDALANAIQQNGIKTVINLRGSSGESWYVGETNTTTRLGTRHYDFPLSATREVTDAEMDAILATIAAAPKPVLIHCKSGSDRTGLVGALYLYDLEGRPASLAGKQLTALYGHLPWFGSGTIAMDRSFWRYVSNHVQQPHPAASAAPANGSVAHE